MLVEPGKTYVHRLHAVVNARASAGASELRLRHALSALDLHPHGLPAHAVVCLRRLHAPIPEHFMAGLTDDPARLRTWAAATVNVLESVIRQAAQPAQGFVPAAAECVVFNDRAELLTCLAVDWCDGRTHARWWWRTLFRQPDLDAPVRLLLRTPEYVPAAFIQLAAQQRLAPFAQKLTVAEALALLDALVKGFALPALAAEFAAADWSTSAQAHAETTAMSTGRNAPLRQQPVAPWQHVVPEFQTAKLTPAQAALIGIGLMLSCAPARVRTHKFAQAVRDWLAAQNEQTQTAHAQVQAETNVVRPDAQSIVDAAADRLATNEPVRATAHDRVTVQVRAHNLNTALTDDLSHGSTPSVEHSSATNLRLHPRQMPPTHELNPHHRVAHSDMAEMVQPDQATNSADTNAERSAAMVVEADARTDAARDLIEPAATEFDTHTGLTVAPSALTASMQIETRYGGLFFLLNLALYLELYGDFSAPLAPCLPLNVWDFVALVGAHLVGTEVRTDAVWSLLAQLAGREQQTEPGADFVPADEWRAAAAWLKPIPAAGAWRWSGRRGRLRVEHPSGFLVLDLPRDNRRAAAQLADELRAYAGLYTGEPVRVWRGLKLAGRTARARWLERLAAYVGVRLRLALGQARAQAATHLLCALPARVAVTATHVDLFFSLAELPVEVRRSGLDRDPGWLPAAGRFIAFHFD